MPVLRFGLLQVRFGRESLTYTYRYRADKYPNLQKGCQILVPTPNGRQLATFVCLGSNYQGPVKDIEGVVGIDYDTD